MSRARASSDFIPSRRKHHETRITDLFGIQYPIIQGAMQWLSKPKLAAAVSNAGGLGTINMTTYDTPEAFSRTFSC